MKRRYLKLAACFAFLGTAWAQDFRATITGRVADPSGAGVPNVPVQVRNAGTNELASSVTDTQGNYTVPFLRPGTYSVSVEAPGFKKFLRDGITLFVSQNAAINITLEVGALTEQVTVTAEAPLLETTSSDRGGVIDRKRVHEFPLNARNPFMLSMLVAGVNFNGAAIYQRPFDNGAIADWSINGSQNRNNEFLLDGAPNNAQAGGNNIAYVPPVDSVQEFKIQTNSYDAQYGKTGGGIVNVSLKSGTNELHGTVYEFARRNGWDANSFQNNARGVPKSGHFLDQYGFQIEGPIYIPKLYNGRNKSFFMGNYEGYREGTPTPLNLSVAQPEFLDGDFSKLVDAQNRLITIFDPSTGRELPGGAWVRDAFPGNRIPGGRIHPNARRLLGFMAKPNTQTPGQGYSVQNLFLPGGSNVDRDDFYNLVLKFDQNFGDKHRVFFRHASNDRTETRRTNGVRGPGEGGQLPLKRVNDAYVIDWVSNVRPTLIFNIRTSFNRYIEGSRGDGNTPFDPTTLGFPASLISQLPLQGFFGQYEFTGYTTLGRYFGFNYTNTWAVHPSFTKIAGAHTIKGGVDLRWIYYNLQNVGTPFRLTFDRGFTQREFNRADALSGNGIATALLGHVSGGNVDDNVLPAYLYRYYAPYIQDDWKLSPRLTLNLGLRWDFNFSPTERYNRINRSFDLNSVNPIDRSVNKALLPNAPTLRGGLMFAGVGGVPRIAANLDKTNIQPRAGGAYQLTNKLVMRGGWGLYFLNPNNDYLQTNGYSQSTPIISSNDGSRTPISNLLGNPFPDGLIRPPGNSLGLQTFLGRGFSFVNPDFDIPYVHQFSFGFQYELPLRSKLEVSYVGNRTKKLQTIKLFNEPTLAFRNSCNLADGGNPIFCDQLLPNPFRGLEPFAGTASFTNANVGRFGLNRPFPHFGGLTERTRNDGAIWYNSMQMTFELRSRGGLNLIATYSLSKMIEQVDYMDVQRDIPQRSLYFQDRPHRVTIGSVWEMPFGKGKKWLNTTHGLWSRILSGWENNIIFQYTSGRPWDLPGNVFYLKEARVENIDWSASRIQGVRPCVARWNDNGTITPQAFSIANGCGTDLSTYNFLIGPRYGPQRLTPTNDGRLRMHTVPQMDLSLNKRTQITEKMQIQFRAEAFNFFNTFMLHRQLFNNNPEDANFGTIIKGTVAQGNANFPRHVQLAVKFIF